MSAGTETPPHRRVEVRVRGTVQGVGFRPFVFRLAQELRLGGFVHNDTLGVEIEVEGAPCSVREFLARIREEAPPLASVESIESREAQPRGELRFRIAASANGGDPDALVSPDACTCEDCLRELADPADRRYRYPFINCTNCGPRFTIVEGVPYDRAATTMRAFAMCTACRREYEDPCDRRFHAQPNACPACGPRVELRGHDRKPVELLDGQDAIAAAAAIIAAGATLAVKGIGGYHLACRADSRQAVAWLRARKHREQRPFAVMVASVAAARNLVELTDAEVSLLQDRARPIVIAPRLAGAAVAEQVAPRCPDLGLMLPYSPLHHILLGDLATLGVDALVMTSGNLSEEPIAYRDGDARARLAGLADAFLVHDRVIHIRTDDSVLRATPVGSVMIRRSRGYVPLSIPLPREVSRPVLAVGAELKSTFCLARGKHAWVSHHIGDLKNFETLMSFREGIEHFQRLFAVQPQAIAHDLHPDYLSTAYAQERLAADGPPATEVAVQHHHAHLAAVLAEHGQQGPAVGIVCDGSGHGLDGTVWGGELLAGDLREFERCGWLHTVRLPGGDRAVREPWRMACAWLRELHPDRAPVAPAPLRGSIEQRRWEQVALLCASELAPSTSSVGRLFDAVAALCGICPRAAYEGQAAIELEGLVDRTEQRAYPFELDDAHGALRIDPRPALQALLADLERDAPLGTIAARFHNGLAEVLAGAAAQVAGECRLDTAVLAGGVFQNAVLLERTVAAVHRAGLRLFLPDRLPPGDGAISYGQAAVAAARLASR